MAHHCIAWPSTVYYDLADGTVRPGMAQHGLVLFRGYNKQRDRKGARQSSRRAVRSPRVRKSRTVRTTHRADAQRFPIKAHSSSNPNSLSPRNCWRAGAQRSQRDIRTHTHTHTVGSGGRCAPLHIPAGQYYRENSTLLSRSLSHPLCVNISKLLVGRDIERARRPLNSRPGELLYI